MNAEHSPGSGPAPFAADSAPSGLAQSAYAGPETSDAAYRIAVPPAGYQPGAFVGGAPAGTFAGPPAAHPPNPVEPNTSELTVFRPGAHGRRRSRSGGGRGRLVLGLAAAVLVVGAGGAFAANSVARHTVCAALTSDLATGTAEADESGRVTAGAAEMKKTADRLRGYGHMLVFDRDLGSATEGLADDLDQMIELEHSVNIRKPDATTLGKIIVIAGSVNTHARDAQDACDLPVTGIVGG